MGHAVAKLGLLPPTCIVQGFAVLVAAVALVYCRAPVQ